MNTTGMFRTAKTDSPVFSEFTVFRFGKSLAYCRQGHGESQNQQAKAYIDLAALHVRWLSCRAVSFHGFWVGLEMYGVLILNNKKNRFLLLIFVVVKILFALWHATGILWDAYGIGQKNLEI